MTRTAPEPGLVTTIIPVYNRARMLAEAVESVLAQTYRPIEILVVDDGSTDDTWEASEALGRAHPEVLVVHQPNRGVGLAREAGRLIARGEFLQHLDSDDILLPEKFDRQVQALREHPEAGAAYGWTRERMPDGSIRKQPARRTKEHIDAMFPAMLQSRWWHTSTPLYRAEVVHAAGPWLPLRNEEDWEYDARIASGGVRVVQVEDWVSESRLHHEGHLSSGGLQPEVLRDRARAHGLILDHALRAGIAPTTPEMQHFARELFLLARQAGAAGLTEESRMLFERAREASGDGRDRLQFRLYARAAAILGWPLTGRLACLSDRLR